MKTIEISEEDYNFLVECKKELLTQNVRCTSNPIYCIQDVQKVITESGYEDDSEWIHISDDYVVVGDDNALFEYLWYLCEDDCSFVYIDQIIKYLNYFIDEKDEAYLTKESDKEKIKEAFLEEIKYSGDLECFGINVDDIKNFSYQKIRSIKEGATFSFFEKDALEHLASNHYHYTEEAQTYACSSWRSPRMNRLRKLLVEIKLEEK